MNDETTWPTAPHLEQQDCGGGAQAPVGLRQLQAALQVAGKLWAVDKRGGRSLLLLLLLAGQQCGGGGRGAGVCYVSLHCRQRVNQCVLGQIFQANQTEQVFPLR